MNALARRQQAFFDALEGEGPAPAALALYRAQVLAGWHEALAATYPVVQRLVGPAFFRAAADAYARAHPSRSGDLHAYGAAYPAFIAKYAPARGLPYLADMARLEAALHASAFAADAPTLDFAALAAVPPGRHEDVVLALHPAARLVRSAYPLVAWWEANQADRDGVPVEEAVPSPGILVARGEGLPWPHAVDAAGWRLLEGCARGEPLGSLADSLGDDRAEMPAWLARLAAWGVLAGFRLAS